MELKEVENKEVSINTKQGLELINVIKKLGIKEEIKGVLFGNGLNTELNEQYLKKQQAYRSLIIDLVEKEMPYEDFEALEKEEQNKILNDVINQEAKEAAKELGDLEKKLAKANEEGAFNLFYTAIIDRLYSNQDVIYTALSSIYGIKVKEIEKQELSSTILMIKKIIQSKDIKTVMKLFL